MECLEIALQPPRHRIASGQFLRLGKQAVGLGKLAEIGFLQGAVDEEFARIDRIVCLTFEPLLERLEIGGSLGIFAAEVATIAFP